MPAAVDWDPNDSISKLALEVARIAHEGLGSTQFERLRTAFRQMVELRSDDPEVQIRVITRLLIERTRREQKPKSVGEVQEAGLCLMWLADTRVGAWSLLQLYQWGEALPPEERARQ